MKIAVSFNSQHFYVFQVTSSMNLKEQEIILSMWKLIMEIPVAISLDGYNIVISSLFTEWFASVPKLQVTKVYEMNYKQNLVFPEFVINFSKFGVFLRNGKDGYRLGTGVVRNNDNQYTEVYSQFQVSDNKDMDFSCLKTKPAWLKLLNLSTCISKELGGFSRSSQEITHGNSWEQEAADGKVFGLSVARIPQVQDILFPEDAISFL